MPEISEEQLHVLETDGDEHEPRNRRPAVMVLIAGVVLCLLVGAITAVRTLSSGLAMDEPGADGITEDCPPGDVLYRTEADETVAEFLERTGYPPTVVQSAAALRDIYGEPLCPEGADLDTCEPGPDRLVCLPEPFTETPPPASLEPTSEEASQQASTPVPTSTPTETPTPTATPTRTPAPAGSICGDGVCQTASENSDVCPQDCHCADNGVCEAGEGSNCLDCSARAGSCGAACTDSAQCNAGLSCASGVCWDACVCGFQCGGGTGGSSGGATATPTTGSCPDPGPYCSCGGAPGIWDCYDGCGNYLYSYVAPGCP